MIKAGTWVGLCAFGILLIGACGDDAGDGDFAPPAGSGGTTAPAGSGGAGSAAAGMGGRSGNGGASGRGTSGSGGASGAGAGGNSGAGGASGAGGSGGTGDEDDAGMVDPCDNVANACEEAVKECDGETLVTCAANSEGCLVETRTNCAATANNVCDEDASPPVCKLDPCRNAQGQLKPNVCVEEGTSCVGDFLVTCEKDSSGCPMAERIDCTLDGNNTACSDDGNEAECVDDPCVGISNCSEEGTTCRGTDLVSCEQRANDCLVEDITDCTDEAGETCDDSGTTARCDECENAQGCTTAGTTCQGTTFRRCSLVDDDDCLDLTIENCGESCNPTNGCVFAATCDGPTGTPVPNPLHATLKTPGSYGEYNTEGAGNEFIDYSCRTGNNTENGPDLLFALDVPGNSIATVELAGPDFASGAPFLFLITDCSDAGAGNAEDSCSAFSTTAITYFNDESTTERVYLVVDSSVAANFGTFGLELDVHEVECGDGVVDDDEQCDDGNILAGDGCNANCRVANGYACTKNSPSVCTERPTDGTCGVLRCALPADAPSGSVLCCTTQETCGLAFPQAYGAACIELAQAGTDDNECDDEPALQGGSGWPQMNGCCQPDDECGVRAGPGLGCVERTEVSLALEDGPGGLYGTPFAAQDCN